jgi:glycine/D-amino acid oxidase-like deaminating enzyme
VGDLPDRARVVVIGGGAVGVSALYHLARAGWADCVLLERDELTAGSTWHAAGNVPTFSSSWSIMAMQRYSAGLYRGLGEAVGYPMNYHVTGSVRLAHTPERMQEFARVVGMGRHQGMDLDLLTPEQVKERHPFVEAHDLRGALYDPHDGDIDPAQLTQALAKGARDLGATIVRSCRATGARREKGGWVVETSQGEIGCEKVVNAAGYRAREVGAWFGRDVPMMTMSHQYLVFDAVPAVEAWSREAGRKLPLLRDVDVSYYLRQEKFGFNLGPYEPDCRAHWVSPDDPMPDDFSFQLFPDDLDRIAPIVEDAMERVPVLKGAGLARVINGPIPYAPDGNPLLGPMPGVEGAYEACAFTFGICQAGGAGKVLAEWVTQGRTEWDTWSCDPRRFTAFASDPSYAVAKGMETYGHEYAIHFPRHAWPAGRPCLLARVSFAGELGWELHTRLADAPAVWDAAMAAGAPLGLRPFGMWALDSLRLEKGYRAWKQDLSTDYMVLQAGLGRFVDWGKPAFRGKAALERERQQGVGKRFVTLTVEADGHDPPYMSTLWRDGQVVGETTSAGWGFRTDRCIALGMLRADLATPGARVEVEAFGERLPATVEADAPLWDPANERLRA